MRLLRPAPAPDADPGVRGTRNDTFGASISPLYRCPLEVNAYVEDLLRFRADRTIRIVAEHGNMGASSGQQVAVSEGQEQRSAG